MKPITEEQRQTLINRIRNIKITGKANRFEISEIAEIALASLTAEPMYWEIAGCIFSTEAEALKPGFRGTPEPLYEHPPVTVIKFPEYQKLLTHQAAKSRWNQCIDEIKRINGLGH